MWMGGIPPLGYEPDGRSLKIVDSHADIVRDIFERYIRHGNVRHVAEQLARDDIISPVRVKAKSGAAYGGVPLTRGQIYGILKCPTYVGEVHHKGQVFEGLHPAIVDRDAWDRVQVKLADNLQGHRSGTRAEQPSMLAGKIIDEAGEPLIPAHACKGRVRYRYYVSRALHHGDAAAGFRIPASEIEALVAQRLQALFADALTLIDQVKLDVPIDQLTGVIDRTEGVAEKLGRKDRALVGGIIDEVRVHASRIEIACSAAAIAKLFEADLQPDAPPQVTLASYVRVTRTGRVVKLVQTDGTSAVATPNQAMVNLLAKAHRWWGELRKGELNVTMFAAREGVNPAYLTRVLRLAFLSPCATDALLAGRGLHRGAADLIAAGAISASWIVQDQLWTVGSR
jgi:hypothetical protein